MAEVGGGGLLSVLFCCFGVVVVVVSGVEWWQQGLLVVFVVVVVCLLFLFFTFCTSHIKHKANITFECASGSKHLRCRNSFMNLKLTHHDRLTDSR